jgi:hypothetical protein
MSSLTPWAVQYAKVYRELWLCSADMGSYTLFQTRCCECVSAISTKQKKASRNAIGSNVYTYPNPAKSNSQQGEGAVTPVKLVARGGRGSQCSSQ